jgi:hypothetical protein
LASGKIGSRREHRILADTEVRQMVELRQNVLLLRDGPLDLSELSAEVFDKRFLDPTSQGDRFLTQDRETTIQSDECLTCDQGARLSRLFQFTVLHHIPEFRVELVGSFRVMANVAEQR